MNHAKNTSTQHQNQPLGGGAGFDINLLPSHRNYPGPEIEILAFCGSTLGWCRSHHCDEERESCRSSCTHIPIVMQREGSGDPAAEIDHETRLDVVPFRAPCLSSGMGA